MNKTEFLERLRAALAGLPEEDIEERLSYFSEMIDDRIEEGASEEEAVAMAGPIEDIVSQTVSDVSLVKLVKERVKPKRSPGAWAVVLIILGFPVWFPLLCAAGAVIFSLYVVLWSLIVSLWAVEVSFMASSAATLAAAVFCFTQGRSLEGIAMIGAGLFFAGISIFLFFGCVAATKGMAKLTKKIALGVKSLFIRKEKTK